MLNTIQVRKMMTILECVCPTLTKKELTPHFQLRDIQKCPNKKKPLKTRGDCQRCDYFLGTWSHDNTYFAHGVYELACMYNTYKLTDKKECLANCKKCGEENVDYFEHYCAGE